MKKEKLVFELNRENKNGRIYTEDNIKPALVDYMDKKHEYGVLYGELYHPDDNNFCMSVENISHRILDTKIKYPKVPRKLKKKLKKKGLYNKSLFTTIEMLNTPNGKIAKSIIKDLSISMRASGKIEDNVIKDIKIYSFDLINTINKL